MNNVLSKISLIGILVLSLIWQGCDPPESPECLGEELFTVSTAIAYQPSNGAIVVTTDPPTTCFQNPSFEGACHDSNLSYIFSYIDDCENVIHQITSEIHYININSDADASNDNADQVLDWQIDVSDESIMEGADGTIILTPPSPDLGLQDYNKLLLNIQLSVFNEYACSFAGSGSNHVNMSLDFGQDGLPIQEIYKEYLVYPNSNYYEVVLIDNGGDCD